MAMTPQEFARGDEAFDFSHRRNTERSFQYEKEYDAWAEMIKSNQSKSSGPWSRRKAGNALRDPRAAEDDAIFATPSSALWKISPIVDFDDCVNPRAKAIAGYRKEMLDLVRGLPETAYELTLRDIVEMMPLKAASAGCEKERNINIDDEEEEPVKDNHEKGAAKKGKDEKNKRKNKKGAKRSASRWTRLGAGFLVIMLSPLSIGLGKGSDLLAGEKEKKAGEEVWNQNEFSEGESGTSRTSSSASNGSVSSSNGNHKIARIRSRRKIGCYPFFKNERERTVKNN